MNKDKVYSFLPHIRDLILEQAMHMKKSTPTRAKPGYIKCDTIIMSHPIYDQMLDELCDVIEMLQEQVTELRDEVVHLEWYADDYSGESL